MKTRLTALALGAALLLAACGGGGDSGNSGFTPPTDDFAVLTGWQNLMGVGGSWTVTGTTADNASWEATLQLAPQASAAFPPTGMPYVGTRVTSTVKRNGTASGSGIVEYFREADTRIAAIRNTGTTQVCASSTSNALPPAAAKVNASGALASLVTLNSCLAGAGATANVSTMTWSLEFERGIVLLCLNSETRDGTNAVIGRENDCVEIRTDGSLGTRARVTVFLPNTLNLVMKNF